MKKATIKSHRRNKKANINDKSGRWKERKKKRDSKQIKQQKYIFIVVTATVDSMLVDATVSIETGDTD